MTAVGPERPLAAQGREALCTAPPSPLRAGAPACSMAPRQPPSGRGAPACLTSRPAGRPCHGALVLSAFGTTRRPQGRPQAQAGAPSRRGLGGAVRTGLGPKRPKAAPGRQPTLPRGAFEPAMRFVSIRERLARHGSCDAAKRNACRDSGAPRGARPCRATEAPTTSVSSSDLISLIVVTATPCKRSAGGHGHSLA